MRRWIILAALALPAALFAEDFQFTDPHVRLVPEGTKNTGAFVVIKNTTAQARKLVKAEAKVSRVVELHTHVNEGGVMKMRPVPSFDLPANGELTLKPGSFHIMLIDLTSKLKEGDRIPITLTFDNGAKQAVTFVVRPVVPPSGHNHDHSHH